MERKIQEDYFELFKSVIDQDRSEIVICNLKHEIIYLNPAAVKAFSKRGGEKLLGRNLLDCHSPASREKIRQVIQWFLESPDHNIVYTYYDQKHNTDVYMVALRSQGKLIGYYEKHECRDKEIMQTYDLWKGPAAKKNE